LGQEADEKSDVWAIGCTVAEMLCGHRLVQGVNIPEIVGQILEGRFNWGTLPRTVPRPLRKLLQACCSREKAKRPSTQDILATLRRLQQRRQVRVRTLAAVAVLALGVLTSRLLWPTKHVPLLDPDRRLTVSVSWNPKEPSLAGLAQALEREVAKASWLSLAAAPEVGVVLSLQQKDGVVVLSAESHEGRHPRRLARWETAPGDFEVGVVPQVISFLEREHIRRDLASEDALFGFLVERTSDSEAARHFREGLRLSQRTRYRDAREKLLASLKADPQFWPASLFLALVAKATADFPEAHRRIAQARALCPRPTTTEAVIQEVAGALVTDDHKRQEEALTRALAVFPNSGYLLYRAALLYRFQDRPENAIPLAKKLIKQGWRPDFSPTWELLAYCQLLAGKPKDALATCLQAQTRFPTRYNHWLIAAYAHQLLGQQEAARANVEEAVRKFLDHANAPRLTAYQFGQEWASHVGWREKSRELCELMLAESEKLLSEDPEDLEALQAKGEALLGLDRPQEALPLFSTLAQSEGAGAYAFIGLARTYAALGHREQGHKALERAETLWRDGTEVARGTLAYNIAVAWATMGELERATLWLSRSKELYGFDRLDLLLDSDLDPLRQAGLLRQFEARP
ncbi:MAG: protein kinase domain-containing protein, partial [Thermoanaerobaculum sp.]